MIYCSLPFLVTALKYTACPALLISFILHLHFQKWALSHWARCSLSDRGLLLNLHLLVAVHAHDIDCLCGPAAVSTLGTDILSRAAGLSWWLCALSGLFLAAGFLSARDTESKAFVHLDILPALHFHKFQQCKAWAGDRPAVFLVMLDQQPVFLGASLKLFVVVAAASAAILDIMHEII